MERPILFSTPMVQAIMEGRKTMTRRVVKPQPIHDLKLIVVSGDRYSSVSKKNTDGSYSVWNAKCPYGKVGDVLWVRETWRKSTKFNGEEYVLYYADDCSLNAGIKPPGKWKPSIHMPKSACRIWLEITNIRVERLQDISEQDAKAEGVEEIHPAPFVIRWKDYIAEPNFLDSPYWSFYSLWCSINGAQSWKDNPWVWVVEFKRINK
jgi:hypothetical protein